MDDIMRELPADAGSVRSRSERIKGPEELVLFARGVAAEEDMVTAPRTPADGAPADGAPGDGTPAGGAPADGADPPEGEPPLDEGAPPAVDGTVEVGIDEAA